MSYLNDRFIHAKNVCFFGVINEEDSARNFRCFFSLLGLSGSCEIVNSNKCSVIPDEWKRSTFLMRGECNVMGGDVHKILPPRNSRLLIPLWVFVLERHFTKESADTHLHFKKPCPYRFLSLLPQLCLVLPLFGGDFSRASELNNTKA